MIQIVPKAVSNVGYGVASQVIGINDGNGSLTLNIGRAPMPFSGSLRNFTVYCGVAHPSVKVDVLIDGASSGLSLTIGPGETAVSDPLTEVFYAAGQTLAYRTTTTLQLFPGFEMSFCVELESDGQAFGVVASAGTYDVGGADHYAGALGNGYWADNRSSYSIDALNGSITALALRRFTSPGGGSFKAWIELDGVLQDGTGGTVDTTCELLDSGSATLIATFDLPVAPPQHVNVKLTRLGTDSAFAIEQIGAGIGFVPTTPNGFMLVGGSNDVIPIPGTSWKWNHSKERAPAIESHQAIISGKPVHLTGLYVEHTVNPGGGETFIDTILSNGIASDIAVTVADAATSGSDVGTLTAAVGDLLTIELASSAGAQTTAKFYWGMAGVVGAPSGMIGPLLWWRFRRRVPTV